MKYRLFSEQQLAAIIDPALAKRIMEARVEPSGLSYVMQVRLDALLRTSDSMAAHGRGFVIQRRAKALEVRWERLTSCEFGDEGLSIVFRLTDNVSDGIDTDALCWWVTWPRRLASQELVQVLRACGPSGTRLEHLASHSCGPAVVAAVGAAWDDPEGAEDVITSLDPSNPVRAELEGFQCDGVARAGLPLLIGTPSPAVHWTSWSKGPQNEQRLVGVNAADYDVVVYAVHPDPYVPLTTEEALDYVRDDLLTWFARAAEVKYNRDVTGAWQVSVDGTTWTAVHGEGC